MTDSVLLPFPHNKTTKLVQLICIVLLWRRVEKVMPKSLEKLGLSLVMQSKLWILQSQNLVQRKIILRDRKRYTSRVIVSPPSSGGGGYPVKPVSWGREEEGSSVRPAARGGRGEEREVPQLRPPVRREGEGVGGGGEGMVPQSGLQLGDREEYP